MSENQSQELDFYQKNEIVLPDNINEIRQRLENWTKAVHKSPTNVKSNEYANGALYVPIEELEMLMDEIFLGHWKTRTVAPARVVGDSVAYDLEVDFLHPVSGTWLTRSGAGAVPLELKAGKNGALHRLDFEKINSKAIQKNAPAAKAYAFRNAVQSIGQIFGRDLNRDAARNYEKKYSKKLLKKQEDDSSS